MAALDVKCGVPEMGPSLPSVLPSSDPLPAPPTGPRPDFAVLDAAVPQDYATWIHLWEAWPDREVMEHPEFVRLFAREGQQVLAAAARGGKGGVLYPFIRRPFA